MALGLALNLQGQLTLFVAGLCLWLLFRKLPEGISQTNPYHHSLPFRLAAWED